MAKRGSDEWKAKISAANKGVRRNPACEFRKGNVPWNKDMKGIHLSPETEFKKGSLHGQAARNWKAVGKVTTRRDKTGQHRRWIKIRDVSCGGYGNWIPLARHLYKWQKGPIPRGHFVVHADGNCLNDDLANLMLMDHKHLFAWQKTVRPKMEERRKTRSLKALRKVWPHMRRVNQLRKAARQKHLDMVRASREQVA